MTERLPRAGRGSLASVVGPPGVAAVLRGVLTIVVFGALLAIAFGAMVVSAARKGRTDADSLVMRIADTPRTLHRIWQSRRLEEPFRPYAPGRLPALPQGLSRAAGFVDPGYLLVSAFQEAGDRPVIDLLRLRDGAVLKTYRPDIDAINARSRFTSALIDLRRDRDVHHNMMMHPLLMPDGGLVIHDSSPLARVDACGRVRWVVDGIFHHGVERAADGSLYAVYRYPKPGLPDVAPTFDDEAIAHVSADGRLLGLDRIADILDRNGLSGLWRSRPYVDDPFHLNDVQPVLGDGRYWRRGDVFLSLRNLSLVMLYRPSSGRVLWSRVGPWAMQHDIAILDDHRISVFDNHWRFAAPEGEVDGTNRIRIYDFTADRVSDGWSRAMRANGVATRAQGRQLPMPNGDLIVEETERGRLLRLAPDGTVRWRYIAADSTHRRLQLRWSRYLDPVADGPAIAAALGARCR